MSKVLIAHRGNMNGPNPEKENHPSYLLDAVKQGFDVEVDVWNVNGKYILGHDSPQYEVDLKFLCNEKFWIHCKNIDALHYLIELVGYYDLPDFFFHDKDDVTLTRYCWIWTYPGKQITSGSIAVMPEMVSDWDISKAGGICTDFVNIMKLKQ